MSWRVWIDTGGTFTDCIALAASGEARRVKVLSSGVIRRRVARILGPNRFVLEKHPRLPLGFLQGYRLRDHGDQDADTSQVIAHTDVDGEPWIEFDGKSPREVNVGDVMDFLSGYEAPVVGAYLLFGRRVGEELPEFELRLGTTRGTNALLEGTVARTAVWLTRGFRDLLHIGDQSRIDIFSLRIDKPPVLAQRILEVGARRDRTGAVVEALTDAELERIIEEGRALREQGFETAAVSLLHSVECDEDERRVALALERAGFEHVSIGSRRSRLRGYLHRTQTAVVDASLAPIMRRYLDNVRRGVSRPFLVMSSAGGLVHVDQFRAKDALLSGPAGGVIGCRHAAGRAGMLPALGFDMGGTSTDVARVDQSLEYEARHEVGGQIVHAAALAIRTVAAGGGSICRIEHDEAMVGPQSAGALPGPACYGAGGPLTLTDVNLLLGRIDSLRFEVPLDLAAAETACALQLARAPGLARDELLEGFLRVANERMADTIRQVSTRRGFDPRDHTLVAFGGAGGQHACAVAELLGIRRVLVPADCSLLSAVGIGVAQPELVVHEQVSRRVDDPGLAEQIDEGERAARQGLRTRERLAASIRLRSEVVVQMRYVGQDEGLEVPFESGRVDLAEEFASRYETLFGYRVDRPIEVDWVRYRVVADDEPPELHAEVTPQAPSETTRIAACLDGRKQSVPRVERASVPVGREGALAGPLLVSEPFSSTWVAAGWNAYLEPVGGGLVLSRTISPPER